MSATIQKYLFFIYFSGGQLDKRNFLWKPSQPLHNHVCITNACDDCISDVSVICKILEKINYYYYNYNVADLRNSTTQQNELDDENKFI